MTIEDHFENKNNSRILIISIIIKNNTIARKFYTSTLLVNIILNARIVLVQFSNRLYNTVCQSPEKGNFGPKCGVRENCV
jgi:hypothetical protein